MSGPDRAPESVAPTSKSKSRPKLSQEDREELAKLDTAFQRIKELVPAAPYILSTPSLHPYSHYSKTEALAFRMGTLFDRDEEHVQYRTFHYREPYQDCFVLQPGEEVAEIDRPKSQASNTSHQGPKMKMSLSAYKSKQANGIITPGSKMVSPNLVPTKPSPTQTNGAKETAKQPSSSSKLDETKSHKRPASEALASGKPEKRIRENLSSQPLRKPPASESKTHAGTSTPSHATPHGLPPLLSPVDQPLNNPYGLPAILSPTLPARVQAELDKLEIQRKRGDSSASTSSSDRKSQLLSVPEAQPVKNEEDAKGKPRIRSVSLSGKSPSNASLNQHHSPEPRLIVKLKYGKRQAATVSKLLRLPPTRKAPTAAAKRNREDTSGEPQEPLRAKTAEEAASKSKDTAKVAPRRLDTPTSAAKTITPAKILEKRPRSEGDALLAVPSKRPKPSQDGFNTPAQQLVSSPALSSKSSAQKGNQGPYATPRKDHKAVNTLRTLSTEGSDPTPGRSGGTPSSLKRLDPRSAPTSALVTGKKQADYQSLSQTSQKLNMMGRSLKHEAQKIAVEKGNQITKDDEKRAAVTSLECILSYMAAYHAQDQSQNVRGRPGEVEATWKTLLPLCMSYDRRTKDFPHLDGLRLYLSAVIAAAICTHVAPRAPRPRAHDSPQDPPRPDSAKSNQTGENFTLLADHYIKLLRFTQEARIILPLDEIQKQYPKSWSGRNTNGKVASQPEKFNGTNFSGPYFLPIQNDTTPIQAVRFGLRFLDEFCEKEKLGYKLRVNLEKPE